MGKKGEIWLFYLQDLRPEQLHILKQELLSVGGDLATPREAILSQNPPYNALLIATKSQLERVIAKCKIQPFGLKLLSQILRDHLRHTIESTPQSSTESTMDSHQSSRLDSPIIMPIINLTPDSFYAPSNMRISISARNFLSILIMPKLRHSH